MCRDISSFAGAEVVIPATDTEIFDPVNDPARDVKMA